MARVEFRSDVEFRGTGQRRIGGYAAVFEVTASLRWINECFARGSCDEALRTSDVRALYNHDPALVLGRSTSGTLRIGADDHGLEYEVDLPRTSYADDLRELVERGDITGASFAFIPNEWTYNDETDTRTHTRIKEIIDVSPVTYPAYVTTETSLRSRLPAASGQRRSQLIRARARVGR